MKPIILNLNEMSDSREVYESKPNIFLSLFVYLVLGMFLVALIWTYFGKIDIVVKSEGILRPNKQVATVVNNYAGTIETVNIEDGQKVEKGDVLYVIEHDDLLKQKDYYEKQMSEITKELENLKTYKKSIEDGENYFDKNEEEYYLKYRSFYINYKISQKDTDYKNQARRLNQASVAKQLSEEEARLLNLTKLEQSITGGENPFQAAGGEKEYYDLYRKYQSDYKTLVQKYDSTESEIRLSTTAEGVVDSLEYYTGRKTGLNLLKKSIEQGKSLFTDNSSYSLQYQEYENKLAELNTAYGQAKEDYDINKALAGLAVTEWEVEQSQIKVQDAKRAIDTYEASYLKEIKNNIAETEKSIEELKLSQKGTLSKEDLLKKSEEERENALLNFQLNYQVDLRDKITALKDSIKSLTDNLDNLKLEDKKVLMTGGKAKTDAALEEYKNTEIRGTIDSIKADEDKKKELAAAIEKLNSQIEDAAVKAAKTGVINSGTELVTGDTLNAGTPVMTIIPDNESSFKANIYVSNKDIGKLKEGMQVKFNVYALPNNEYGYLTGRITKISKDLKVDEKNASGYYLVEASINGKSLYDSKGKEAALKTGMSCQAQMIIENKRILKFVLEKMNFLKN
ncbi:HlyD family efflux transporter periplasmic adaptor subunit [Anaerocolumna xylanovorans]|uniref:HlyD family secretion protein n=1 Tax=Anaerocolumna xylanovorans DSM 12503 TaxID=1121345 RepID=A0A1M7YKC2_9FIRM|nr:HlyD family efflux transporter periplasmic adaptor subunit [Anaerocolumna xylanovorans]SHO52988.1 HlyD family secretion protein [Anaerocolumna xylanovorans DSM 12503]